LEGIVVLENKLHYQMSSNAVVFQLSGAREMVDEEKAALLLSEINIDLNNCTAIKLSNKSFSTAAAALLIAKIKESPSITVADISDIIAGRPEEEALRTLSVFCDGLQSYTLKEVNLSDNALGKKGIVACNSVLTGKAMEVCYLA
jgi:Ran GTPase-activating protein (RanGAP) involved in mRNA processing and transport